MDREERVIWISKSYDHPRQLTLPQKQKDPTLQKLKTFLRYKIMFLPAYSPSFSPIELIFEYFKMILKREWKSKIIKLAQKEGMNAIKNSLKKVSSEKVICCFRQFYKELSLNIELIKRQLFSARVASYY